MNTVACSTLFMLCYICGDLD